MLMVCSLRRPARALMPASVILRHQGISRTCNPGSCPARIMTPTSVMATQPPMLRCVRLGTRPRDIMPASPTCTHCETSSTCRCVKGASSASVRSVMVVHMRRWWQPRTSSPRYCSFWRRCSRLVVMSCTQLLRSSLRRKGKRCVTRSTRRSMGTSLRMARLVAYSQSRQHSLMALMSSAHTSAMMSGKTTPGRSDHCGPPPSSSSGRLPTSSSGNGEVVGTCTPVGGGTVSTGGPNLTCSVSACVVASTVFVPSTLGWIYCQNA
mmetsp:Transcript_6219/g.13581  ORF Transcript_6219/g.13581 Transcript_6219/m.13581 type:complete len:265 (-) Transcript_6219:492-1286(-)